MSLETVIISLTLILITFVIRDTVLKIHDSASVSPEISESSFEEKHQYYIPKEEQATESVPDIPEVADKEWAGTPDNPYTPDLGSEQLHALHAEFDQRIEDLKKELEYEEQQLNYVVDASKGLVFSEDADQLAKQLASKVKVEVAE